MSSNSALRILATAPIVSAFRGRESDGSERPDCPSLSRRPGSRLIATAMWSSVLLQIAQLVLADLDLVPVLQQVGLDPPAVHVGAVQRPQVVDVVAVLALDQQRVVAGYGHVVQEDVGVGRASDGHALALDREALPRATPAGADHQGGARLGHLLVDVDGLVL